jgi:hypothetical protein
VVVQDFLLLGAPPPSGKFAGPAAPAGWCKAGSRSASRRCRSRLHRTKMNMERQMARKASTALAMMRAVTKVL